MERVLLISPRFFEYHLAIREGIRELGFEVDWFDDQPNEKSVVRAFSRLSPRLIEPLAEKYFEGILAHAETARYRRVILLRSMSFCFTEDMMKRLKERQKDAEFVVYLWDSAKNLKDLDWTWDCFDRCYTFEPDDVGRSEKLRFLPLFYAKPYELAKKKQTEPEYDCFYYGTAHPKKLRCINEMADGLKKAYPRMLVKHYMPSKFKYVYHKLRDAEYKGFHYADFETRKLTMREMADLVAKSRCVLDSPQAGQKGLTMRTLECLGAGRKLITANGDVKNYDFYREENICVYQGGFDFSSRFFTEPYCDLPPEIYGKYSLKSWLTELLGLDTDGEMR